MALRGYDDNFTAEKTKSFHSQEKLSVYKMHYQSTRVRIRAPRNFLAFAYQSGNQKIVLCAK